MWQGSKSHPSSGCVDHYHLDRGWGWDGWLVLESGVRQDFPSSQGLPLPRQEQGLIPSCCSRIPEGEPELHVKREGQGKLGFI